MRLLPGLKHKTNTVNPSVEFGCPCKLPQVPRHVRNSSRRVRDSSRRADQVAVKAAIEAPPAPAQLGSQRQSNLSTASQAEQRDQVYNWTSAWYPVAVVEDLDPSRPHQVLLLGREFVVWRDKQGTWRAFQDLCPHRKVPLSEGRIHKEDGTLECAYHGWRFGSSGQAVVIPQLGSRDKKAEENACNSSRSCATAYPCQVQQGLLWLWPDSSPDASETSKKSPPAISPVYENANKGSWTWSYQHFVRDIPGSFDVWVENMCDQSHVAHAHHGVAGDRHGKNSSFFKYLDGSQADTPAGGLHFDFQWSSGNAEPRTTTFTYLPPSYNGFTAGSRGVFSLWIYAVPRSANSTRLIISAGADVSKLPSLPAVAKLMAPLTKFLRPRWRSHMELNGVTDGDIVFMSRQSMHLKRTGGAQDNKWAKDYYMPADSDRGVAMFRRWLSTKGSGGPPYADEGHVENLRNGIGQLDRQTLLNRYSQHTANCKSCSKAAQTTQRLQTAAKVAIVVSLLAVAATLGRGAAFTSVPVLGLLGLSAAMTVAAAQLNKLRQRFYFTDWQHSER